LALSRGSSNSADWADVAATMVAFEAINNVRLEVRMATADHRGTVDIALTVVAVERSAEDREVRTLASANVRCSAMNLKSLEAALIHALYILDGRLAEGSFAETLKA
jgi:hypothetical protein